MKNFIFFSFIIATAVITAVIIPSFAVFGVVADLLLVCVILASLYCEWKWALGLSFLSGILKDSFSVFPLGIFTLLFPIISFITLKASRRLAIYGGWFGVGYIFFMALSCNISVRLLLVLFGSPAGFWGGIKVTALGSIYTALSFPLMNGVVKFLLRSAGVRLRIR